MESDSSKDFSKSQTYRPERIVLHDPQELRPHPSYANHGLSVSADKLSALREQGELAFVEPLTITRDRFIIDGYVRWELAKELKRPIVHCLEYELSETEALQWLLQRHRRSNSFNDYSRILLALDLEPELTEKARTNRQTGGQLKGWSNLTRAEQVHVRSEIAKAAAVSTGNVTKVKQLNETCISQIKDALYNTEVSIHWAWKLRNASHVDQFDALGRLRFEKGLKLEIHQCAARRRKRKAPRSLNANEIVRQLNALGGEELSAIRVTVLKSHEPEMFITEALARMIGLEQLGIWNQSIAYKNSPAIQESFGTRTESDRQSAII